MQIGHQNGRERVTTNGFSTGPTCTRGRFFQNKSILVGTERNGSGRPPTNFECGALNEAARAGGSSPAKPWESNLQKLANNAGSEPPQPGSVSPQLVVRRGVSSCKGPDSRRVATATQLGAPGWWGIRQRAITLKCEPTTCAGRASKNEGAPHPLRGLVLRHRNHGAGERAVGLSQLLQNREVIGVGDRYQVVKRTLAPIRYRIVFWSHRLRPVEAWSMQPCNSEAEVCLRAQLLCHCVCLHQ